jgi:hypothetical protein
MLTFLAILASIGLIVLTTMSFVGGVYSNRAALPMCAAMFIAIIVFGAVW